MNFLLFVTLVIAVGIAVFAIQNSGAAPIVIRFLVWRFETSLIFTILGSVGVGILLTLLFWASRAAKTSLRKRRDRQGKFPA
jgi:uncharacterized integral membrane protein